MCARDVREELEQRLLALRLEVSMLRGDVPEELRSEAEERLTEIIAAIDEAIESVRRDARTT